MISLEVAFRAWNLLETIESLSLLFDVFESVIVVGVESNPLEAALVSIEYREKYAGAFVNWNAEALLKRTNNQALVAGTDCFSYGTIHDIAHTLLFLIAPNRQSNEYYILCF